MAHVSNFRLLLILAFVVSARCQCPTQCSGCGTTSMDCALISPFDDFAQIPSQVFDLTFRCLEGGTLNLEGLLQLSQLRDLKIHNCLSGTITSDSFSALHNLEYLNISHNEIGSVHEDAFRAVENLMRLDLSHNNIGNLPSKVFQYTRKLAELYLDNNKLSNLPGLVLEGLQQLTKLQASYNDLSDISGSFSNLPEIQVLDLSYNNLLAITDGDLDLVKLRDLDLAHNQIQSIQNRSLDVPSLQTLNLAWNKLSKVDVIYFPSVLDLNLANNQIQTVPSSFSLLLRNMEKVDLSGNPFHCNCDLEHLRLYYIVNQHKMESLSCVTPSSLSFEDITSPLECTEPDIAVMQSDNGLRCQAKGDPTPKVTWFDAMTGNSLVTSLPPSDVSVTSNDALLRKDLLGSHSKLLCGAINTAGSSEEKCFVFQTVNNATRNDKSEEGTVPLGMFIGCLVGVFVGTLTLVMYIALCCKFCSCKKDSNKQRTQRSHVNGQGPYYAQPQKNRKRRKHTPRPWEFPPHYPAEYDFAPPHPQSQYAPSENIYQTIRENQNMQQQHVRQQTIPTATIEELPSDEDDDDIKQAFDSPPETKKTPRIIELSDTPSTSCTNIPQQNTPAASADPLPVYTVNPLHRRSSTTSDDDTPPSPPPQPDPSLRFYSASTPNFGTPGSPLSEPQPSVFAANRRASDRVGFFSTPPSTRSSSMIITGELFVDPRPFQGINMERMFSPEFGHEINV